MKTTRNHGVFGMALVLLSGLTAFGGWGDRPLSAETLAGRGAVTEAGEGTGYGQITFINATTTRTLYFYVNGEYAGRALPGLTYTAQVKAGPVTMTAVDSVDSNLQVSDSGDLEEGASGSWTVSEF